MQPTHRDLARAAGLSDDEVVANVLEGDVPLFEAVMRRHNERLYRAARAILKDAAEAEDVLQEAYVRAWRRLSQYRGGGRLGAWLTRIVVHEALARASRKVPAPSPDLEQAGGVMLSASNPTGPEEAAIQRELRRRLEGAVDRLPRAQRLVFMLREVEGLSVAETSESLGITAANVKVRLHRARQRLQDLLEREVGTAGVFTFERPRCDRLVRQVLERLESLRGVDECS